MNTDSRSVPVSLVGCIHTKKIFTLVPGGAIREWKIFDVGGHRSQVEVLPFIADSPKLTLGYR